MTKMMLILTMMVKMDSAKVKLLLPFNLILTNRTTHKSFRYKTFNTSVESPDLISKIQILKFSFQSSYVDVQDEVTDLRDEDIIEAVPGTTVVMTSAGVVTSGGRGSNQVHSRSTTSNVDVVAAAVNEAIKDIEYEAATASAEVNI